MNRIFTFPLLLGFMLMGGTAQADTLFTPPLVPEGSNQLDCYLVNVGNTAHKVTIEALTREGETLKSIKVTLKPGTEAVATVPANQLPRYCKFVVEGKSSDFRGSILVRKQGTGSISALSAE